MIQSNAFESNASANANADESNANASANASAAKESSASANANAAFALAFANASAFEHKPAVLILCNLNVYTCYSVMIPENVDTLEDLLYILDYSLLGLFLCCLACFT